jgi:hypothetical protein
MATGLGGGAFGGRCPPSNGAAAHGSSLLVPRVERGRMMLGPSAFPTDARRPGCASLGRRLGGRLAVCLEWHDWQSDSRLPASYAAGPSKPSPSRW